MSKRVSIQGKKYTPEELQTLRSAFDSIDTDGNGKLDVQELRTFMGQVGMEESFSELVLFLFDADHNGTISFPEFTKFLAAIEEMEKDPHKFFKLVFDALDVDGSGSIEAKEMVEFGRLCGMPMTFDEANQAIKEIDQDNSGSIDFAELCQALGI